MTCEIIQIRLCLSLAVHITGKKLVKTLSHTSSNVASNTTLLSVQYHPEVVHSERGIHTLKRFLTRIAGLEGDWSMQSVIDAEKQVIAEKVGPDAHVICALSGGVDSTVAATLVHSVRSLVSLIRAFVCVASRPRC